MTTTDIIAGSINLARFLPENEARAIAVTAEIDSMDLDLFGAQETEEWLEARILKLSKNPWLVVSDHVNCPLFARADKFQRVVWNKEAYLTLDMPGSVRKRYGSAAMLKRISDGFVFVAVTIHPSNQGESSNSPADRVRQAEYVWARLVEWGVTDFPIMLLGDMNDKKWAPEGLPGVFVKHGMTDVLKVLNKPATIDRAFVLKFTSVSTSINPVASSVSDHDFRLYQFGLPEVVVVPDPPPVPPVTPPVPETTLDRLNRIHGKIKKFRISSFEIARKSKVASRYVAVIQDWLGLEVTCRWSESDQKAFDLWRHNQFPKWLPFEYKGPAGIDSVTKLAQVAKSKGKKVYTVSS